MDNLPQDDANPIDDTYNAIDGMIGNMISDCSETPSQKYWIRKDTLESILSGLSDIYGAYVDAVKKGEHGC